MKGSLMFLFLIAAFFVLIFLSSSAMAAESIYICRPCSRAFIPEMNEVISKLGLEDTLQIKTTSCLGFCDEPYVLKFRDQIYRNMNRELLEAMLKDAFEIQ
ncbi:MAG TPA: (2Fe-2S) ferredoxin domain-containing protein [Synergistales bacterium]|nr:(2Fe-2S) ferredoxin domain-containing protein [Synergistales bacterium]